MEKKHTAGIVACSNGVDRSYEYRIYELKEVLSSMGISVLSSDLIYDRGNGFSGTGKERAKALMDFYGDDQVTMICDISGGDIANEVLPYLDYELIKKSNAVFWGYSDLTTIINGIYAKTGKPSVLYQIRNLVGREWGIQRVRFENTMRNQPQDLFDVDVDFVQGDSMEGVLVGGNIRCLLKLAGTQYWPDMTDKILFLEARSGKMTQIVTYFAQLKQLGVFEQIKGLILGTFTELESCIGMTQASDLIKNYVDENLPVAVTKEVGHGADSKAVVIGGMLKKENRAIFG